MKPRKGEKIFYTGICAPIGRNAGDFAGTVVSYLSPNIVNFRDEKGNIDCFIWRFQDGLNKAFTWGGKESYEQYIKRHEGEQKL